MGQDTNWIEVSLTVNGELAEAVAEVLARFASGGVVIESTAIAPDPDGEGYPIGPLRVCAYLPADQNLEENRRKLEEALWYLGRIQPLPEADFRPVQEINWVEAWKEHYQPIPIGRRLMVVPAWLESPLPERISIRIDPSMAFGTGTHPTTQMCLEMLEDYTPQGQPVIDVGCGSAILSIAAIKLGASHALGVDIEQPAIPYARANAQSNGVDEQVELGVGSVAEIKAGEFSLKQAPLVFANIIAPILIRLLDAGMVDLLSTNGVLVMSGILVEQWEGENGHPSVKDALARNNLRLLEMRKSGDWLGVAVSRGFKP